MQRIIDGQYLQQMYISYITCHLCVATKFSLLKDVDLFKTPTNIEISNFQYPFVEEQIQLNFNFFL